MFTVFPVYFGRILSKYFFSVHLLSILGLMFSLVNEKFLELLHDLSCYIFLFRQIFVMTTKRHIIFKSAFYSFVRAFVTSFFNLSGVSFCSFA